MIGWIFLFVLTLVIAWLFTDSKATRGLAIGVLVVVAALVFGFFFVIDRPARREAQPQPDTTREREAVQSRRAAVESRFALQPSDIGMVKRKLLPGIETFWDNEGNQVERADLFSWTFSGEIRNQSEKHTAQNVTFSIQLFSCPSYFTTPVETVLLDELTRNCNPAGTQNVTLYGIDLGPGKSKAFSEDFKITNQQDPRNWRYWADVSQVGTQAE